LIAQPDLWWEQTSSMTFGFLRTLGLITFGACVVFSDCWQALLNDVTNLAKEVSELLQGRATEKHVYMSLPRPGVSSSIFYILKIA
jgi:hypothetical protein